MKSLRSLKVGDDIGDIVRRRSSLLKLRAPVPSEEGLVVGLEGVWTGRMLRGGRADGREAMVLGGKTTVFQSNRGRGL